MKNIFLLTIVSLIALGGCKSATDKVKKDFLPLARGEADEIILVIDSTHWKSTVGDEIKDLYQEYMPMLPQDEHEFALNKVNPRRLNSVLKHAKNMIFVMTLDSKTLESRTIREYFTDNSLKMIQRDSSLFYTVRRDEFAKGQIVLYLFGQTEEQLVESIRDNKSSLKELFASAVRERVRDEVYSKVEKGLTRSIAEEHTFSIQVPYGWSIAKNLDNFVWMRYLESDHELNVFCYEGPYRDQKVFNKVDEFRDEITSEYLRDSEKPQLFIQRQAQIPILTKRVTFKKRFAVETRGLWKISDSSGGGPFVSYTFVDEDTQKIYYIEGYVYAPATKKKHLVRKVESILSTFEVDSIGGNPS
ncbi:MAG: DUF4837 family protein [Marinoscillum sp.]